MCLATVVVDEDGERKQIMEDVAWTKSVDRGLLFTTLTGESRRFDARIDSIDLMTSVIVLKGHSGGVVEEELPDQ
jgi:predicted RNA-binding protein